MENLPGVYCDSAYIEALVNISFLVSSSIKNKTQADESALRPGELASSRLGHPGRNHDISGSRRSWYRDSH